MTTVETVQKQSNHLTRLWCIMKSKLFDYDHSWGSASKETAEKNVYKEQGFSENVPKQEIRRYLKGNSFGANAIDHNKTYMNEKASGGGTLTSVLTSAGHTLKELLDKITGRTSD